VVHVSGLCIEYGGIVGLNAVSLADNGVQLQPTCPDGPVRCAVDAPLA
jgi:hypothetical protein